MNPVTRVLRSTGGLGLVVLVLVASLPLWFIQTNFVLSVATLTLIFMAASLGWNVISGFGGQISFGHSIFFGLGAYTTAILQVHYHLNAYLGVLVGVVVAVALAVLLGAVTLRLRGIYFSLATFALTLVFAILTGHYEGFTGGEVGLTLPLLGDAPGQFSFENKVTFYWIAMILAALAFVVTWLVLRSRLGLQLRAIQADQEAAQASGVLVFRVKLTGLVISAVPGAVAGSVYMQYIGFIDPDSAFGATLATQIAVIAFVGGAGKLWGPVVGAVILVPLQQLLNSSLSAYPAGFNLVVYALVVLVILWIEPRGIMSMRIGRRRPRPPRSAAPPGGPDPEPASPDAEAAVPTSRNGG
ncbi:branched-chain amino acid ABC transporter permease [Pseudonocardia sp. N23]|uniref:branched-chain amino acid ABC transporter permease n=1 Tax=Pseudonocardia sp. N23 TaxID=1987376 RepID=UPI000BFB593C|nr:branched-chain amino acid ABC transporter permease [Pseudonocardia sp. N23]GAY11503.1 branched-chain amino acid transport system permease protein LivM [Pseudonocardia sp. N23]